MCSLEKRNFSWNIKKVRAREYASYWKRLQRLYPQAGWRDLLHWRQPEFRSDRWSGCWSPIESSYAPEWQNSNTAAALPERRAVLVEAI